MTTKFMLTAFLLAIALPAHAEVYKWRDAQGQVNYSNVPSRAEARIARPVQDQISIINPIDIKPAARGETARVDANRATAIQAGSTSSGDASARVPAAYLPSSPRL